MKKNYKILLFSISIGLLTLTNACKKQNTDYKHKAENPEFRHLANNKLTDVVVHDIFSPPVSSRIYSYTALAAYEALVPGYPNEYKSMVGQINDFKSSPQPEKGKEYCYPLASLKAFFTVARKLTFTVSKYDSLETYLYSKYTEMGVPEDVMERSKAFGESVGNNIVEFSKTDNYGKTRGLSYSLQNKPGSWTPTPPAYSEAVEPNWGKIRSIALDSVGQFKPASVIPYSTDKNSPFWKEMMEVYNIGNHLTDEQKRIAFFWDDNSFVINVTGHLMFANKKMTPAGHWMAINETACKKVKADIMKVNESYLLVSSALRDAFIECWEMKYRTHKIRPETAITKLVDQQWHPYLQTPPFPEYSGGHSTISRASSTVMSKLFGDSFAFTDSTEYTYGHGVAHFNSFKEASDQASLSRIYGGIHYRSACDQGILVGNEIGLNILEKLHTHK